MARPKKPPPERRDRKIVTWMTAVEQARFLVNATRVGLTAPDYIRTLACGADLKAAGGPDWPERIVLSPTRLEFAALMKRAGADGLPLDAYLIRAGLAEREAPQAAVMFELVDALVRDGTILQRMLDIAAATGVVPDEVRDVASKIERLLDKLLP